VEEAEEAEEAEGLSAEVWKTIPIQNEKKAIKQYVTQLFKLILVHLIIYVLISVVILGTEMILLYRNYCLLIFKISVGLDVNKNLFPV
jgi:ABC-type transport system involved in cytochrome bd biosynthesis fused ATPase/permease subunit